MTPNSVTDPIFGKMTLDALPHLWYTVGGTAFVTLMGLGVALVLTRYRRWGWLWREWLTSTDPKKIGIMYLIVSSLMMFRGGIDAGMMLIQQALAAGGSRGFLSADHFQQIFTSHGDIMVFFVAMGFFFGLMNLILPLQIGTRDLAFPFVNSLSFWLYAAGAVFINLFFVIGGSFAAAGWLSVVPLSELRYSPGVGIDYWAWSLQLSGLGTLLGGINFIVTIIKKRAPGMTLMRMPLFAWASLCSMVLVISAFPVLTAAVALLWLDRFLGMHLFTESFGGNQMMYINLIWMWGHPEVYILVLPAFGMFSEIVSTFSRKRIFNYASMVGAAVFITLISYLVWLHHFFTMGAGADVNGIFGAATMLVAIPMAVQVLNWILTMRGGRIVFALPMYWFIGFLVIFVFGGMAGVLLGSPAADFQLHNTLFLVAHFHTMIMGAIFGIFAGISYWFSKIAGFRLDETWGRRAFWLWLVGFFVTFIPLYTLGFMGATRRLDHYPASTGWQPLYAAAAIGFLILVCGSGALVMQLIASYRRRREYRDRTGDPWDGRTLEWSVASPPPFYVFAASPEVRGREAFWEAKRARPETGGGPPARYDDIVMPRNTGMGLYISGFAFLTAFALVWHMVWLAGLGLAGAIACVIVRSFAEDTEYVLPASEVARIEAAARADDN